MSYKNKVLTIGSNILGSEFETDSNLNKPMGISTYNEELWVANNGSGLITHYNKLGKPITPTNIVVPHRSTLLGAHGIPTGLVYNKTKGFVIRNTINNFTAGSYLLAATEDGYIVGYNSDVNDNRCIIGYDSRAVGLEASYKGLAIYDSLLYATDYKNNKIDVIGNNFGLRNMGGANFPFTDPNAVPGHSPFGISVIAGEIVVTYVSIEAVPPTARTSYVNVFSTTGVFLRRLVSGLRSNSPWGIASLTKIDNRKCRLRKLYTELLLANYNTETNIGSITKYGIQSGTNLGPFKNKHKKILRIPNLWGLNVDQYNDRVIFYTAGASETNSGTIGVLIKKC